MSANDSHQMCASVYSAAAAVPPLLRLPGDAAWVDGSGSATIVYVLITFHRLPQHGPQVIGRKARLVQDRPEPARAHAGTALYPPTSTPMGKWRYGWAVQSAEMGKQPIPLPKLSDSSPQ